MFQCSEILIASILNETTLLHTAIYWNKVLVRGYKYFKCYKTTMFKPCTFNIHVITSERLIKLITPIS